MRIVTLPTMILGVLARQCPSLEHLIVQLPPFPSQLDLVQPYLAKSSAKIPIASLQAVSTAVKLALSFCPSWLSEATVAVGRSLCASKPCPLGLITATQSPSFLGQSITLSEPLTRIVIESFCAPHFISQAGLASQALMASLVVMALAGEAIRTTLRSAEQMAKTAMLNRECLAWRRLEVSDAAWRPLGRCISRN